MACDQVNDSYLKNKSVDPVDTTKLLKKVLLEDFTAHRCGYCPEGGAIAKALAEESDGQLIVMAIHSGSLAEPKGTHKYDFRTPEGTELYTYFGNPSQPKGLVNRKEYNGNLLLERNEWESAYNVIKNEEADMKITIEPAYNQTTRKIDVSIKVNYLKAGTTNHHLCAFIVEDSIVKYQLDYNHTPNDIEDYVHNHVLRYAFAGTWGEQLSVSDIASGAEITKQYSYTIPETSDWRPEKLRIIAYVHDKGASQEILQVEEKELFK